MAEPILVSTFPVALFRILVPASAFDWFLDINWMMVVIAWQIKGNILTIKKKSDRSRYSVDNPFGCSRICSLLCIILCRFSDVLPLISKFPKVPNILPLHSIHTLTPSFQQGGKKSFSLNYSLVQVARFNKAVYSYSNFASVLKCLEYSIL